MYQKAICIAIIIVITIILFAYYIYVEAMSDSNSWIHAIFSRMFNSIGIEAFTSKYDKAQVIYDWFKTNPAPTYIDYRAHVGSRSNIVEYEDVLELAHNNRLSIDTIRTVL